MNRSSSYRWQAHRLPSRAFQVLGPDAEQDADPWEPWVHVVQLPFWLAASG